MSQIRFQSQPEPFFKRWFRRTISISLALTLGTFCLVVFPFLLLLLLAIELPLRRPWPLFRVVLFLVCFFILEAYGVLGAGLFWVLSWWPGVSRVTFQNWNRRLQASWGAGFMLAQRKFFRMRFIVRGGEHTNPGPYILLMRHASTGDTILPLCLITWPHRMGVRYVMKRELLWDPCLDVVGQRIPNYFVQRGSDNPEAEINALKTLAVGMESFEFICIFPEGTRFTRKKQKRILEKLRESGKTELLQRAQQLRNVLPPRQGGFLGLLEAAGPVDIVIGTHVGFDDTASLKELLRGSLMHRTIELEFWRFPASEIPRETEAQVEWLHEQWQRVDAWVTERLESRPQIQLEEPPSEIQKAAASRS